MLWKFECSELTTGCPELSLLDLVSKAGSYAACGSSLDAKDMCFRVVDLLQRIRHMEIL